MGLIGVYLSIVTSLLYFVYNSSTQKGRLPQAQKFSPAGQIKLAVKKARSCPIFLKMIILLIPVSIFAKGAVNFIPAYLVQARGLTQEVANLLYIVFMGLIIPGKTLSGGALDRKGARWTFLFDIGFVLIGFAIFSQVPGL
ncbi:MAG: hypothetical protein V5A83_01355 [Candidatus Bipolaricaulota bacterium]